MSISSSAIAAGIVFTTAALAAQSSDRTLPAVCHDAYGASTAFATPASSFRAQYWYSSANLPVGWPVTQLGVRLRRNTGAGAQARTIEIVVDNSAIGFSGLSATFNANLSVTPTTFFASRIVNFPAVVPTADPNVAAAWFPGDNLFLFAGPNLLVDFRGGTATPAGTVLNDGVLVQPPAVQSLHLPGSASCGGTLSASYSAGNVDLLATGLLPNSIATFHIGFENVAFAGLRLPLDVTAVGLPGCHLATVPFVTAQVPVTASGTALLPVSLAISPTATTMFSAQVVHTSVLVPASLADVLTTNGVHNAVGLGGLCNTVFAPNSAATTGTQGPNPVNSAIALLLR